MNARQPSRLGHPIVGRVTGHLNRLSIRPPTCRVDATPRLLFARISKSKLLFRVCEACPLWKGAWFGCQAANACLARSEEIRFQFGRGGPRAFERRLDQNLAEKVPLLSRHRRSISLTLLSHQCATVRSGEHIFGEWSVDTSSHSKSVAPCMSASLRRRRRVRLDPARLHRRDWFLEGAPDTPTARCPYRAPGRRTRPV